MRPRHAWTALVLAATAAAGPFTVDDFQARYRRSLPEEARQELVVSLGQLRDRRAGEILSRLLDEERASPYLQAWIVKTLCEDLGDPAALRRVAECLKDRRTPRAVALVAQRALANVADPRGLAWMASEGLKDPACREDMAWALAGDGAFRDPSPLLRRLGGDEKDWRIRTAAAAGLARMGDPATADAVLSAAGTETSAPVLRHLLAAAGTVAPREALPFLERSLEAPDARTRLGALEGLGAAARQKAVRGAALGLLVRALSRERGRLRADAARILEAATGKRHGLDAAAWRALLQAEGMEVPPGVEEGRTATPEYYGLQIPSRRIVFLIEASREMEWDRETLQRVDRLARAKREVAKLLEALPPEAAFGVAAFGVAGSCWKDGLVQATPEARAAAKSWVDRLSGVGWPDMGCGLETAWRLGLPAHPGGGSPEDLGADTLVLVSSGTPLWGELPTAYDLQRWVMVASRYRSVVIHTVGIGSGSEKPVLQGLAAQTGGRFRNVD